MTHQQSIITERESDRIRCIQLKSIGWKDHRIARELGRTDKWVRRWKRNNYDQVGDRVRFGRPRVFDARDLAYIESKTGKVGWPPSRIAKKLTKRRGSVVSGSSVRNALLRMGYKAYNRPCHPLLSPRNIFERKRLGWMMDGVPTDFWENVVFEDESLFPLNEGKCNGNQMVWAKRGEDVPPRRKPGQEKRWMCMVIMTSRGLVYDWFPKVPAKKTKSGTISGATIGTADQDAEYHEGT